MVSHEIRRSTKRAASPPSVRLERHQHWEFERDSALQGRCFLRSHIRLESKMVSHDFQGSHSQCENRYDPDWSEVRGCHQSNQSITVAVPMGIGSK